MCVAVCVCVCVCTPPPPRTFSSTLSPCFSIAPHLPTPTYPPTPPPPHLPPHPTPHPPPQRMRDEVGAVSSRLREVRAELETVAGQINAATGEMTKIQAKQQHAL